MPRSQPTDATSSIIDLENPPAMLNLKQVAAIGGFSEHHAYNLVVNGDIKGVRFGRAWRVPTREFLALCGLA